MIKLICIKKDGQYDISDILVDASWEGDINTCSRKFVFKALSSFDIPLSSIIIAYVNNKEIFRGFIFDRQINNPSSSISYTAFDYGEKLNKIKVSYNIKNKSVKDTVKMVLLENGFDVGNLSNGDVVFSRVFMNVTIYDLIQTAYSIQSASDKKQYYITANNGKIDVVEKGKIVLDLIFEEGANLIESSVSESLNGMVNNVIIVDEKGKKIKTISDSNSILTHGTFQEVYEIKDDKDDYLTNAKGLLNGIENKMDIKGYGDETFVTGTAVVVRDYTVGLQGKFFIDGDQHTFENNKHTVSLTLNRQNLMKIAEAGQEESSNTSSKKTNKDNKKEEDNNGKSF